MAKKSKFGTGSSKTIKYKGKDRANVTKDQLEGAGFPTTTEGLRKYMNAWNKSGKRPTANTVKRNRSRVDKGGVNTRKMLSAEEKRQRDANRNKTTTPRVDVKPIVNAKSEKVVAPTTSLREKNRAKSRGVMATDMTQQDLVRQENRRKGAQSQAMANTDNTRLNVSTNQNQAFRDKLARQKAENERKNKERMDALKRFGSNVVTKAKSGFGGPDPEVTKLKSDWFKLTGDERKKFGNQASYIKAKLGQTVAAKRSGGMVKVAGYKKGGLVKGRKKSIDGIARKGKTKARHR